MLTVENLTKKFGARRVLSDVGFNVGSGEVLGLIGPKGAGKTTVLNVSQGCYRAIQARSRIAVVTSR